METKSSFPCSEEPANFEALCKIAEEAGFYSVDLLAPRLTPKPKDSQRQSVYTD
jgi:hypothetical protein